ncbi:ParB/RepB/Spo0J family partition protein [Pullulanibacillus sp. KACC 23026]|uniref:ParB/RepB/Spo0J family partition protein n=1 Tax=Pullulanibacillus sp. KACC 23026 TaxID=3028315 RepID=UPI0023AEB757|nr:ParB/RepB/Spo0J family partition protein [Pullulanibacillus sp. KACC 23026]WEG12791.1 ParB/RepB/Spo0J family partition protein [Pullulanibacillus sp. KACC 23026]
MMSNSNTRGLGKGINAFFPENEKEQETVQELKIKELRPNPYQPRKVFDEEAIQELKVSVLEHGIIQPLIVRKGLKGYEIVAGERRYRAAIEAKLKVVPAIVKSLSDRQMMQIALIENLQREDLNPIEEANAYRKLMDELNLTQEELAKKLGKSRPHIANHLRLLQLNAPVQGLISDGKLSMGHGRALLGLKDKSKLSALVDKVIKDEMNVRELEALIQNINKNVPRETLKPKQKFQLDPVLRDKESWLKQRFGTSVSIKANKKGKGKIEIEFYSGDDLTRLLELFENR